jgi:hypothetical protein
MAQQEKEDRHGLGAPEIRGWHHNSRKVRSGRELSKVEIILKFQQDMAERVGFEPTVQFPAHTLSKRAP